MFNPRSFVSRGLVALFLFVLVPLVVHGEDLLYARVDNQLFTVDTQTGVLTFVSDGPLQWLASPTFDEAHHTTLWPGYGPTYTWGNPFTGQSGGPYPATLSYNYTELSVIFDAAVYVPSTER